MGLQGHSKTRIHVYYAYGKMKGDEAKCNKHL